MALELISANRIESLFSELAARLAESPLASPFNTECVVVPSPAMARWVNLQLAQAHGVAANLDYPLPASWVWELTGRVLDDAPQTDPLERQRLSWQIFALLPTLLELPAFQPLQHYLSPQLSPQQSAQSQPDPLQPEQKDGNDIKRWQLATRIADVLDRYQFYRPALIRQWSRGEGDDWQALLWRALIADLGDNHRVAVIDRLIRRLQQGAAAEQLPERISLFAISSLPPLFVDVLHALSTHPAANCTVSLYLHSPTDQYWADLKSKKALSRLRIASPDEAAYYDTGNELLASWGRQGQALQDLLLNHDGLQAASWEDYRPPAADNLLHRIQQDIFTLGDEPVDDLFSQPSDDVFSHPADGSSLDDGSAPADGSVQLHICHSPLRECQVLHDQLLKALDADPSLKPEDILVMVPEISRYAPFIEAVFRKDELAARPFIPWNLSDIAIADEHPLIRLFFQLLALPGSRFSLSEMLSYLDVPELTENFALDAADCDSLRDLLAEAGVRWGLDGAHKQELGLPAYAENTWQQAEHRLFAGYALGDSDDGQDGDDWLGIAPIAEAEGSKALALGHFWRLFSRLRDYRQSLGRERSAADWQLTLNRLLDECFSTRHDDDGKLQQIRDSLDELHTQAGEQILSADLMRQWLNNALGQQTINGRYFSGGVTFCGMRPMRSLPFRVICLLGMNDLAFPRREQALEFDGMIGNWQPGDPRKGDEDRYLLLETLLCTRQMFYISYCGRSLKDNSERQPSVLVQELLDFIDSRYSPPSASNKNASEHISQLHPLQAFSPRNYCTDNASYDRYWCDIANALQTNTDSPSEQLWPDAALPLLDESRDIDLKRLRRFLQHPVKYFFNHRLRIYLQEETTQEDEEDFTLNHLQNWQIKTRLLDDYLQRHDSVEAALTARGLLPHGIFSSLSFEHAQQEVAPLKESLEDFVGQTSQPQLVSLEMGNTGSGNDFRLSGQITRYFPGRGLLHYSPSTLKGKALLALWLDHLALCASGRWIAGETSTLICRDQCRRFAELPQAQALQALQKYLDVYWQGLQSPLPVFPDASYAWAQHKGDSEKATESAIKKAMGKWNGNTFSDIPGDKDDGYIQLALRESSANPLNHPDFARLSEAFYSSALDCGEIL